MLLCFSIESMRDEADLKVKFEAGEGEAGVSGEHAHVYGGAIPYACLHEMPLKFNNDKHALLAIEDGKLSTKIAAAGLETEVAEEDDWSASENDDLERFDQHTYDLDD